MQFAIKPIELFRPEVLRLAVFDGLRLGLRLHYSTSANERLKASGAIWSADRAMWLAPEVAPGKCATWLREVYAGELVDLRNVKSLLRAATAAPQPDYFTEKFDVQVFPLSKGNLNLGRWAVSFHYDAWCVRALRRLKGRYHKPAAAWQVKAGPQEIIAALQEAAGVAPDLVFVHATPVVLEDLVAAKADGIGIKVPSVAPKQGADTLKLNQTVDDGNAFLSADLPLSKRVCFNEQALIAAGQRAGLRPYQFIGVRHLVEQTGACLGDDMGLGKSRQTVVAARLIAGSERVLILCPASLRINWEREIHAVYPRAAVGVAGEVAIRELYVCQWVIASYERLAGLVREVALQFAVMAIDEAHNLKEHKAGRTQAAFMLAARIPRRYVVTGTPLLNREIELHTLLRLTGHRLGRMPLAEFRKHYTGSPDRRGLLAQALRGWLLRRRKDVLKDLGHKHRQIRWISPPEGLGSYRAILGDMSMTAMPKITSLRKHLEALKTPYIVEAVQGLADDDRALVFCEYRESIATMQAALADAGVGCVTLTGSDSGQKRQQAIDAFQNDPRIKVFLGTTGAAGVGITLTAANYVFLHRCRGIRRSCTRPRIVPTGWDNSAT